MSFPQTPFASEQETEPGSIRSLFTDYATALEAKMAEFSGAQWNLETIKTETSQLAAAAAENRARGEHIETLEAERDRLLAQQAEMEIVLARYEKELEREKALQLGAETESRMQIARLAELSMLNRGVELAQSRLTAQLQDLSAANAALRQHLNAILGSRSWRLTAPLRKLKSAINQRHMAGSGGAKG